MVTELLNYEILKNVLRLRVSMPFLVIVKKLLKLNIIKARKKKMIEKTIEIEKLRGELCSCWSFYWRKNLVVVYAGIDDIHIFIIVANKGKNNNKNQISIQDNGRINCSEQPLAPSYTSDGSLFV